MKRKIWSVVKYYLMYWVFYLLPVILAAIAVKLYARKTGTDIDIRDAGTEYWFVLLGAVLGVYFFLRWKYAKWSLGSIRRERLWQVIAVSALMAVGWFFVDFLLQDIFDLEGGHAEEKVDEGLSTPAMLLASIAAPVLEEVVFRGAILRALLSIFKSPWLPLVISSVLFGLSHLNEAQVFGATLWGLAIGWVYYRTRSLLPCVAMHVVNNSTATLLELVLSDSATEAIDTVSDTTFFLGEAVLAVIGLVIVAFGIRWFSCSKWSNP